MSANAQSVNANSNTTGVSQIDISGRDAKKDSATHETTPVMSANVQTTKYTAANIIDFLNDMMANCSDKKFVESWEKNDKDDVMAMLKTMEPVKKTRKKKEKDPNAPKKKRDPNAPKKHTAWNLFASDVRAGVKAEFPEKKAAEITTEIAALWKNAGASVILKYANLAKESKAKYDEEMKTYVPTEQPVKEKKAKKAKVEGAPKHARSAWLYFSAEERPKIAAEGQIKGKAIVTELAARWKALEDKSKYEKMAAKDKKRFTKEDEDFKKTHPTKIIVEDEDEESQSEDSEAAEAGSEYEDIPEDEKAVSEIIDNFSGTNMSKKYLKEELKKRGLVLEKERLNELIVKLTA